MTKLHIAFYKAEYGNWVDKLIAFMTNSKYSHCELVLTDGLCASSSPRDGGVRQKRINLGEKWDIYTLEGHYDQSIIKYWFDIHDGQKYNWLGAIGSLFGIDIGNDDRKFCSYCCSSMLLLDPIVTPERLFRMLKLEGMIKP